MIVRSLGALFLLAIVWGGSIPLTKLGLRDIPPLTLTALRYLAAAPCFLWLLRGRRLPPPRACAAAAGLGLLGIGVGQVSQTLGVRLTPASVATVISALIPVFVVALAAVRLRQPVGGVQIAGLAAALVGVALVAGGDPRALPGALGIGPPRTGAPGVPHPVALAGFDTIVARGVSAGTGLLLLSSVAVALYYVLSVELIERYSVLTIAAVSSLAGAAALTPIAVWELGHAPMRVTVTGIAVVLYLGLLVTVAGLWIWFGALTRLPARIPAALQYLQPIVGVLASAALFDDRLDRWFWTGTALVLAGIALSAGPGGARRPGRAFAPWRSPDRRV
ncbi:MAG TPA: DMT family transporter [bacterium]|nr:DMT family transporter [bacterium]